MTHYRVPEMTKSYIEYDMIQDHTSLPELPEFRARLLYAFLNREDSQEPNSELYTLATTLVQIALDTHDLVPVTNSQKEKKEALSRQMRVLAGDYFSSRFYNLLSQAGQIEMIQQLSGAICEVNRMKVNLYQLMMQLKMTTEEYLQQTVSIKMQLFLSFNKMLESLKARYWPEILRGYTQCEVLAEEIFRSETLQNFNGSWGFWHLMQVATKEEKKQLQAEELDNGKIRQLVLKYNVPAQLYRMMETQFQQVVAKIRQLDSEQLIQELLKIGEPFTRYMAKARAFE